MEIIDKKEFAVVGLNADNKTFILYVAALVELTIIPIHPSFQAQVTSLISRKTGISAEYSDFSNIFSSNSTVKLMGHPRINDHSINLLNNRQSPHSLIYSLGPVQLKTLKTYIKANLTNGFIKSSKSSANTSILFAKKKDNNFHLCVDYWGLNNLIIKNHYPLPLIDELLNYLGCVKHLTQLDLKNTYHQMRIQKITSEKQHFKYGKAILSTKSYFSVFLMLLLAFKSTSTKFQQKNLMFLLSYTSITF